MNIGELRLSTVQRSELERRWEMVRQRMATLEAGAFLTIANDNILSGFARWLTDSSIGYRRTIIVYAEGLSTAVEHGSAGVRSLDGHDRAYPGIGKILNAPAISSIQYTQHLEAELTLADLRAHGVRRILTANLEAWPVALAQALQQASDIELIDDTEFMDRLKAIKSDAELADVREAARIQDEAYAAVLDQIAPGMHEYEVIALAEYEMRRRKGEFGTILMGSAAKGSPIMVRNSGWQGRKLQKGDAIVLLIEIGSPSGYFLEVGRTIVLGSAWPTLREAFLKASAAQATVVEMLRPGVAARDVHRQYLDYMEGQGLEPDRRLFAHGQGYDLVERPLIRDDECMILEAGMCLSCHPAFLQGADLGFVCDNVILHDGAPAEWIHKTPRQIFEI